MAATVSQQDLPKVLFGTSSLGNLFIAPSHEDKRAVVEQVVKHSTDAAGMVFDANHCIPAVDGCSAGRYKSVSTCLIRVININFYI